MRPRVQLSDLGGSQATRCHELPSLVQLISTDDLYNESRVAVGEAHLEVHRVDALQPPKPAGDCILRRRDGSTTVSQAKRVAGVGLTLTSNVNHNKHALRLQWTSGVIDENHVDTLRNH